MLKKSLLVIFFIPTAALLFSFSRPVKQQVLKTIIIDAGHGIMANGGRNGAKGTYSYEDDICLAVSKKLIAQLSKDFPEVKIVETRPTKYSTELHERANIANQNKGDLFISIHVNAMPPIEKMAIPWL
jgi:N-acetylmuramoyl-L-alanine amidase